MKSHNKALKPIYIIAALNIFLILILLIYCIKLPVNSYLLPVNSASPDIGRMEPDGYYFDSEHADLLGEPFQKIFLNIPEHVSKGSYTIRVKYRSGAASTVSVTSLSNPEYVKCDNIALNHLPMFLPGSFNMDYGLDYLPGYQLSSMYITHDVDDLDVFVIYSGFQSFYIESVELIGNRAYLKTILPAFILILLLLDSIAILLINNITPKNNEIFRSILFLSGISLIASIPVFYGKGIHYDDFDFLYLRLEGIKNGLLDGQLPVRIHSGSLKTYGYALSYFYPDLFLYPFALLRIIGYSLNLCIKVLSVCINLATSFVAYYSLKKVFKCNTAALAGSVFYTLSIYRLVDIFSRGAIAEAIAMIFLPLFIAGLYIIITDGSTYIPLAVAIFGLINSHILSCEMAAIFSLFTCILCFKKIFKKSVIISIIKALSASLLLSSYFIIPFIHFSTTDSFKVYSENAYLTSDSALNPVSLLALYTSTYSDNAINPFVRSRYSLGFIYSMLVLAGIVYLAISYRNSDEAKKRGSSLHNEYMFSFICAVLGILASIMTTSVFPWRPIEAAGGIIKTFFCMVQFPWRYLSIASALFTFVLTMAVKNILGSGKIALKKTLCAVSIILTIIPGIIYLATVYENTSDAFTFYDKGGIIKNTGVGMGEYEPVTFPDDISFLDKSIEELQTIYNEHYYEEAENGTGLTIESFEKSGTKATAVVLNPTDAEKILYMPYTYYYGYEASNAFEGSVTPEMFETEFGTIGIKIPGNYYNAVHIQYKEPLLYRFAEALSLITFISLICIFVLYKKGKLKS